MLPSPDLSWMGPVLPGAIGVLAYIGATAGVLAPNIVMPRLAEKNYLPQCIAVEEARIANALTEHERQQHQAAQLRRQTLDQTIALADGMLPGLGAIISQSALSPAMDGLADTLSRHEVFPGPPTLSNASAAAASWCECVVETVLADRWATGLYVASWRLYVPPEIALLEDHPGIAPAGSSCQPRTNEARSHG